MKRTNLTNKLGRIALAAGLALASGCTTIDRRVKLSPDIIPKDRNKIEVIESFYEDKTKNPISYRFESNGKIYEIFSGDNLYRDVENIYWSINLYKELDRKNKEEVKEYIKKHKNH